MRKVIERKVKVIEEETSEIICDSCGKKDVIPDYSDIQTHRISFGYGSKKDGETHIIDICDDCYDKIISKFKHKPEIDSESGY